MAKHRGQSNAISGRAFSDGTQDAFVCVALSGSIVAANPAAETLLAGNGSTLIGHPFDEARFPERLRRCVLDLTAAARAGVKTERRGFDIDGLGADGQTFNAEAEVFISSGTREPYVVVHLHAIGPRAQSEREQSEREKSERDLARLSRILATMTAGVRAVVDADDERKLYAEMCRVIVDIGRFPMAWVGLAEHDENCTVRPVACAGNENGYASLAGICWDDRPNGCGPAGRAIRSAAPQVCNDLDADPLMAPWRDAARERGYRSLLALPLKERGAVFGVLVIYAAEANAFGAEEQSLLVELAENISYGVVALHDRKARGELEQALKHAEKLEAIGALSGGIVHDFNNLLQVVISALHVIQRRPDDAVARNAAIETIKHTCKRASTIAGELLALSRKDTSTPETLEPAHEAEKWRELIIHSVHAGVQVEVQVPAEIWPIHCDPASLEVALINIAVNARDAMPEGGLLTVSARNLPAEGGDCVEIAVTDSGGGIDPEVLKHAFEPFYTTKPVGKGTGLGLSQVFRFAKQARGEARIASQPGQGVTVTLRLPRDLSAPQKLRLEALGERRSLPVSAPRRGISRAAAGAAVANEPGSCQALLDLLEFAPPSACRG